MESGESGSLCGNSGSVGSVLHKACVQNYCITISSAPYLLFPADVPAPWIVLEYLSHGDIKSFLMVSKTMTCHTLARIDRAHD